MLSVIEVLLIFLCGYMCKATRDYLVVRKMDRYFRSIPMEQRKEMARQFINDRLDGE